jgi:succinyl-CoA synthetase beta subunit
MAYGANEVLSSVHNLLDARSLTPDPSPECRGEMDCGKRQLFADKWMGGGAGTFALKILSPDIAHKTDVGLVRLAVPAASVRHEAEQLLQDARTRQPAARIDGVLVQRMERGVAEVIVGFRRDPEVGPVVILGAGGVAAELKLSLAVRLAPVSVEEAQRMIDDVRELALLRGYRNLPRGDCAALAQAVSRLSLLAEVRARTVLEAEINPLIVKREDEGVVAVDGLVVLEPNGQDI